MQMYVVKQGLVTIALCDNKSTADHLAGVRRIESSGPGNLRWSEPLEIFPCNSPFADLETMVKAAHVNIASEDIAGFEYLGSGAAPPPGLTEPVSDMVRTGSGPSWAAPIVDTIDSNSTFQASVASAVLAEFRDNHDASKIGSALDGMLKALNKIIIPIIKQHETKAFHNGASQARINTGPRVKPSVDQATENAHMPDTMVADSMGTDAAKWAKEFNQNLGKLYFYTVDEGWLIGWFANAIHAGQNDVLNRNKNQATKPVEMQFEHTRGISRAGIKAEIAEKHGIHTTDDIIAALIEQNEDLKKTVQPLLGAINHALRLWYTWRNKPHHTIMEVVALDGAMNNLAELKTKTPETLG